MKLQWMGHPIYSLLDKAGRLQRWSAFLWQEDYDYSLRLRGHGGGQHGAAVLVVSFLGAALAGYENSDALDHFGWRASSFGEEDICAAGAVERIDGARDDHGGQTGVKLLGATDEFVTVHLGHDEVAEEEVEAAG